MVNFVFRMLIYNKLKNFSLSIFDMKLCWFKTIAFLIILFMGYNISWSQQSKIDSLLSLIKKDKEDTNKVNHLNNLAFSFYFANPDSTILFSLQAAELAEKINFKRGIANAYGNCGTGNSIKDNYAKALEYYFKALKIDEERKDMNGIATRLGNIGLVYRNQSDYPKALD